jgi:hypothetical protein
MRHGLRFVSFLIDSERSFVQHHHMNMLNIDAKANAVSLLCEGNSIRSIERITGIHRGYGHAPGRPNG